MPSSTAQESLHESEEDVVHNIWCCSHISGEFTHTLSLPHIHTRGGGEEWRWECVSVGKSGIFWTHVEGVQARVKMLVCVWVGGCGWGGESV